MGVAVFAASLLTLAAVGAYIIDGMEYSSGERVGIVQKFSKKGILCKTYEGQLAMFGGSAVSNNDGTTLSPMNNIFEFTVENSEVAKKVEQSIGQKVVVHYVQAVWASPCRTSSSGYYFVDEVKVVQ
jgi:hypothetical protein